MLGNPPANPQIPPSVERGRVTGSSLIYGDRYIIAISANQNHNKHIIVSCSPSACISTSIDLFTNISLLTSDVQTVTFSLIERLGEVLVSELLWDALIAMQGIAVFAGSARIWYFVQRCATMCHNAPARIL